MVQELQYVGVQKSIHDARFTLARGVPTGWVS